jgi:3-dehydroquinate dehydratase
MTMLAVSISAQDEEGFLKQLDLAVSQGAEAVEVRVDALTNPDAETVLKLIRSVKGRRSGDCDVPRCFGGRRAFG